MLLTLQKLSNYLDTIEASDTHVAKQLSMAATAVVIWLCACMRYWPDRGMVYVCPLPYVCFIIWQLLNKAEYDLKN